MNMTKEKLVLLKHGLDLVCKSEGGSLANGGLNAINAANVGVLGARLALAVELGVEIDAEFKMLVEAEEKKAASGGKGEGA